MRNPLIELCTYAAASAVAFAVDVALLFALVKIAGWHYLAAGATSFVVGGGVLYFLCIGFVFRHRRINNPALELPYFIALGIAGLAINSAVMYTAIEVFGLHLLLAKLSASACAFGANFLLRRVLLFSPPPESP